MIEANIEQVRRRIRASAALSGRTEDDVRLVAAGKNRSVEEISRAISAGLIDIGESKVQEMAAKQPRLEAGIKWHFIGSLQRNKVKRVVGSVELIQSVDRLPLGLEIDKRAAAAGLIQRILVQVNVSGESSKQGADLKNLNKLIDDLDKLLHIKVEGLMTIAPLTEDTGSVRRVFAKLKQVYDNLAKDSDFRWLSMGMTNDFEAAVEEGANMVRIGSAIFEGSAKEEE